ncbi:S-adenosylmethionine:tRNA ribosyltransferase-isomerase, partial [Burkholderia sp. SIMBA_013]
QTDYQTIYAREKGAVAAPTAGLHFTPDLFAALDEAGIERHFVTLHVGAGTFLPVKSDDTDDHKMHFEIGHVSQETADRLNAVKARG